MATAGRGGVLLTPAQFALLIEAMDSRRTIAREAPRLPAQIWAQSDVNSGIPWPVWAIFLSGTVSADEIPPCRSRCMARAFADMQERVAASEQALEVERAAHEATRNLVMVKQRRSFATTSATGESREAVSFRTIELDQLRARAGHRLESLVRMIQDSSEPDRGLAASLLRYRLDRELSARNRCRVYQAAAAVRWSGLAPPH